MELYLRTAKAVKAAKAEDAPGNPPDGSDGKPLIPLRLPVSLVASLSNESRIAINRTEAGGGSGDDGGKNQKRAAADAYSSLAVSRSGAGNRRDDCYPLEKIVDREKSTTEWYRPAAAPSEEDATTTTAKRELLHFGTTNMLYAVLHQKSSVTDLKEIGRRTRRLLEEERKKRKEIVRLNSDDELLPRPRPTGGGTAASARKPSAEGERTVTKKATSRKPGVNARKRRRRAAAPDVDGWTPAVEDVPPSPTGDDRSNVVRVHGLPAGTRPEQIRKFFDGLNPSLVFALPSFANHVRGWDPSHDAVEREGRLRVERHPPNFRVYVRFVSAPVADAAIGRSGEPIGLDGAAGREGKVSGAAIALSPVPKYVASFLLKHMAIHARKGEPITDTVTKVEKRLGTATHMIWIMATKKLDLKEQMVGINHEDEAGNLEYLGRKYTIPTNKLLCERLVKVHNRLVDTHEKLEVDSSLLYTHTFDPSCMEDAVHRITRSVSNWLLDEIYVLGRLLKESRQIMVNF